MLFASSPLVILPTYNPTRSLGATVEGLSHYVIIDNGSTDLSGFVGVSNIEKNSFGPTYEIGGLLHAYEHHPAERYLLIHDSIEIRDMRIVEDPAALFGKDDGVYALSAITPSWFGLKQVNYDWIHARFPEFNRLDFGSFSGIQYNAFSATREQIGLLIKHGYLTPERLPRDKVGSQSWERVLGAAFKQLGVPVHFLTGTSDTDNPYFKKEFLDRQ